MSFESDVKAGIDKLVKFDKTVVPNIARPKMERAMEIVYKSTVEKCPKDTGDLVQSISTDVRVFPDRVEGTIKATAGHAIFVHEGTGIYASAGNGRRDPWVYQDSHGNFYTTRGQRAQPFMRQAVTGNMARIRKIFGMPTTGVGVRFID